MPTRRELLQIGSIGLSGLTLPRALRADAARPAPARSCLLLYMDGGPSQIDLFDLKPHAPAEIRGPYQPIETSVPGIQLGELLPHTARVMQHLALVRSVRHTETVHDPAVYQMLTGYKHTSSAGGQEVEDTDLPHLSSAFVAADRTPAVMPKSLRLPESMRMEARLLPGQLGGTLGPTFDPLPIDVSPDLTIDRPSFARERDVSATRLSRRAELLRHFQHEVADRKGDRVEAFQQQALEILASPQIETAFDLDQEPAVLRDRYGRHRHGQSVLLARRLIEAGARFITVYWGREPQDWADGRGARPANNPWDTHRNHFPLMKDSLVPRADQTLAALVDDLHQRGLLHETLVVWMGDFGRTPRISKPWASRDHWPDAFSVLMAGGGVPGGIVHGSTDAWAAQVTSAPVTPADLTATIFNQLGIDPHATVADANGRPHVLSHGQPIRFS